MNPQANSLPETYASLRFMGDLLDPRTVTDLMEIGPTFSYRKGDAYAIGKKNELSTRKFGLWLYSTRNLVDSHSIKIHVGLIEERIMNNVSMWPGSKLRLISSFIEDNKITMDVGLYWFGPDGSRFPEISKSFLTVVAMAGGSVETDFRTCSGSVQAA